MELRQLRYFVKMVELGNMTRAARELFVAQPSLSHQLAQLEEALGVKLLERSVRGVSPTQPGRLFYQHAKAILRQVEDTQLALRAESEAPSGEVSVVMPSSTTRLVAMPLLRRLVSEHPAIRLKLMEAQSTSIPTHVQRGEADIAVTVDQPPTRGLRLEPLLTETLFAVMPPSVAPNASEITVRDFARLPLVLPDLGNSIRRQLEPLFRKHGLAPSVVVEVNVTSLLVMTAVDGLGATVLPWSAAAEHVATGHLVAIPLSRPRVSRELALCRRDDAQPSPAVRVVMAILRETCNRLAAEGSWRGVRMQRPPEVRDRSKK